MGVAPTLAVEDDESAAESAPEVETAQESHEETDGESGDESATGAVAEVELSEDDYLDGAAADLFTSVEDAADETADGGSDASDDDDGDSSSSPTDFMADGLGGRAGSMEERVTQGVARFAVIGLDEEHKMDGEDDTDCLEAEFRDLFDVFGVGYYATRVVEEYVVSDGEEEIDPAWGLLGSLVAAMALVVWMRPDGEEKVAQAKDAVNNIVGGGE